MCYTCPQVPPIMTDAQHFLVVLAEQCQGIIRFDRFMKEALFHPEFGYYASNIRTVGRHGDFSTLPTRSRLLACAVAQWMVKTDYREGHVIELGAGTGELAEGILKALGWWKRRRLAYHIVEISQPLLHRQKRRLGHSPQIHWHADITAALENCGGRALIFSNEFVDAFPVRVFQKQPDGWRECALHFEKNRLEEVWIEATPPSGSAVEEIDRLPDGAKIEVAEAYCQWLVGWVPLWKAGKILTIDYGNLFPELYYRRPLGTVRGFFHHQLVQGREIYQRFGYQDLTADVNFSDLVAWGAALGLVPDSFDSLGEWLERWIPHKTRKVPASLLDPYGIGGSFKVLCQTCGEGAASREALQQSRL